MNTPVMLHSPHQSSFGFSGLGIAFLIRILRLLAMNEGQTGLQVSGRSLSVVVVQLRLTLESVNLPAFV